MAENLDALKCGGWGVFIAPTTKMVVGMTAVEGRTRQSGAPPDTVRCASHVTQPLGFDRGASDMWATGQSGGAPDMHCSLSGAPSDACFDFCARRRVL
jgi:hypothetical protein